MMVCELCRLRVEVTLIAHSNGSNSRPLSPSWKVLVELDAETHETGMNRSAPDCSNELTPPLPVVDDFVSFIVDHIGKSADSIVRTNVSIDGFTVPLDQVLLPLPLPPLSSDNTSQRTTIFRDNDMVDIRLEAAPPAPLKECSKSKKRADKRKRTKKSKQVAKEVTKEVVKEVRAPARRERSISSSSSSSSSSDSDHSGSTGDGRRRLTAAVVTAASSNAAAVVPKAAVVSVLAAGQQPMDVQSLWAYVRSQQTASAADEQAKAAGLQTPAPRVYEEEEDYYDEEGEYEDEDEGVFEAEGEQEEDEGSVDGRRFRDVRSTSSLHNGDTVRFHLLHLDDTSRAPVLSSWVTGTVQMVDGNRLQISTSQGVGVWKRDDLFDLQVHAGKDYEEDPLNSSLLLTEGEVEEEGDEVDQDESLLTADIADLLALKRQRLL